MSTFFVPGEIKLFWPWYVAFFFSSVFYFTPGFAVVYYLAEGISTQQASFIVAFALFIGLFTEIPTGLFADTYGRKKSVVLGYVIQSCGFLGMYFANDFWGMVASAGIVGLGSTFISGALEAWATSVAKNNEVLLHAFFTKRIALGGFGLVLSGIIGAWIVKTAGLGSIWIAAFASLLFCACFLGLAHEHFERRKLQHHPVREMLLSWKKSVSVIVEFPTLRWFFLASCGIALGTQFHVGLSWVPYLKSLGLQDYSFGYMWSGIALMTALAPIIAQVITRGKSPQLFYVAFVFLWGVSALGILLTGSLLSAFVVLFLTAFFDFSRQPSERVYFQGLLPEEVRATMGSVEAFFIGLVALVSTPVVGFVVQNYGGKTSIAIAGVILVLGSVCAGISVSKSLKSGRKAQTPQLGS